MAVLSHFEATVSVNGRALPEYDPDDEDDQGGAQEPNTVVKYIESVSDVEFKLDYMIKPTYSLDCGFLSWETQIDGEHANAWMVPEAKFSQRKRGDIIISTCNGVYKICDGTHSLQKFKFSKASLGKFCSR
jgi:hypothetical protein